MVQVPQWAWVAVSGGVPLAMALVRLVRYRMWLTFLRHVYERHGDRRDLKAAGRALAPVWPIDCWPHWAADAFDSHRCATNAAAFGIRAQRRAIYLVIAVVIRSLPRTAVHGSGRCISRSASNGAPSVRTARTSASAFVPSREIPQDSAGRS